jgi:hypothetical protein
MSALPAISATVLALIFWVLVNNLEATVLIWTMESMLSIPRDVKHGLISPVTWSEGWTPPGDGKASIAKVAFAKVAGFMTGLLLPISGGSPVLGLGLLLASAIKNKSAKWVLSSIAINLLYAIEPDSLLLGSCLVSAITHLEPKKGGNKETKTKAPSGAAAVVALLTTLLVGNAPGVSSASIGALIEGCPLWSLGFAEGYIEGCTLGKLFRGLPSSKGFLGVISTEMTLGSCLAAAVLGFGLGIKLMPTAEVLTEQALHLRFMAEVQFWACVLLLDSAHKPLVVGGLLIIRSITRSLKSRSGLLIPTIGL